MHIPSLLVAAIVSALISGCATGSAIVTGTARPPVPVGSVKLYMNPPADYETIGLVRASSDAGFTQQGDLDYAVREMKRRAAKMGANGVILTATGSKTSGGAGYTSAGALLMNAVEAQTVEGRAVFVNREK